MHTIFLHLYKTLENANESTVKEAWYLEMGDGGEWKGLKEDMENSGGNRHV